MAASVKNKIKQLKAFRDTQVNRLNEINGYAIRQDLETDNTVKLQFRLRGENLNELYSQFIDNHQTLVGLAAMDATEQEMTAEEQVRSNFESLYFTIKALYHNLFNSSGTAGTRSAHAQSNVRLPKISLPTFDGNIKLWPNFIDLFKSMIHTNEALSNMEKFQYLISALSNEPLALVKTLPTSADNYQTAYNSLINRYQNKRLLATAYWQEIIDCPKITSESAHALRHLLDTFTENISALNTLQFPTDYWDFILFNLMIRKLDTATATRFELEHSKIDLPSFCQLKTFVERQCKALDSLSYSKAEEKQSSMVKSSKFSSSKAGKFDSSQFKKNRSGFVVNSTIVADQICPVCSSAHAIYRCDRFLSSAPSDRYALIKRNQLCINCFSDKHFTKACNSKSSCKTCHQRHHSLLHFERTPVAATNVNSSSLTSPQTASFDSIPSNPINVPSTHIASTSSQTPGDIRSSLNFHIDLNSLRFASLLPTALLDIFDSRGTPLKVRALIDTGSMASFMTEKCLHRLGLRRSYYNVPIHTFGKTTPITSKGQVECSMRSCYNPDFVIRHGFVIMKDICNHLPDSSFSLDAWPHLVDLQLADPHFNVPAPIDILLGADILAQIWKASVRTGEMDQPIAIETVLGWIIVGKVHRPYHSDTAVFSTLIDDDQQLDATLKRFWMLEELPNQVTPVSSLDLRCEEIFAQSHIRDPTGRFQVRLPFKGEEPLFVDSRCVALKRYGALERKLSLNSSLYFEYSQFIQEYLTSNQMELVVEPLDKYLPQKIYYIPHHAVFKPDSSTTKIRIVFDASTKNGQLSLNDNLLSGPKLQRDIVTVLSRFRLHAVAFTADIKQMFRQIEVTPEHRDYQRILWRPSLEEPIKDFRIKVVTFGLACSPYLALRSLYQLAQDEKVHFPRASDVVLNDVYVDDIVTGCDTLADALSVKTELCALLMAGRFELRKWSSNNAEFMDSVPIEEREQMLSFDRDADSCIKILGLRWCPSHDCFSYHINTLDLPCTKRSILSEIARIFDPLGFLAPLTFFSKRLIQLLWVRGLGWDDPVSEDIRAKWSQYKSEIPLLSSVKIARRVIPDNFRSLELHGFADASELGYAAVVYFRFVGSNDQIGVSLICGKSKVAPLKRVSLPRLELCACVLLSSMIKSVLSTYERVNINQVFAWSDSTVALNWIKSESFRWKTFISNRVTQIQDAVPASRWFHVPSALNPADCASRGLLPSSLLAHGLWWTGPEFCYKSIEMWPKQQVGLHASTDLDVIMVEERKLVLVANPEDSDTLDHIMSRYSSLPKILRIVCYTLRFAGRSQTPHWAANETEAFAEAELHFALLGLVAYVQSSCFGEDIARLKTNKSVSKPLKCLSPFLDERGLLRVGGRLNRSKLPYDQKHPILLPSNHRLTALVIQHYHNKYIHPGTQTLHYLIAQNFWIVSAKRVIRSCTKFCLRCYRLNPRPVYPKMADLPYFRVSQLKAFQFVGVDFGGPFNITLGRTRGAKVSKAYLCLFVCAATKALHLELVSQLSTDAFLAGLRRFIARRGRCSDVFSDQGTNFIGAARHLAECMKEVVESEHIRWHFNPPAAPHFGGLYEAGIKSVKSHLVRIIGDQILTYEELYTVLTQIEAVLNSRPLCPISNDPNDLQALTPGHFLTLNPLSTVVEPDLTTLNINRLDRWQLLVRIHQDFWKRWHLEYLHTLQQRLKWNDNAENIALNTLVLMKDEQTSPLHWLLGRVIELHPGSDGVVRVVTVRTAKANFKRSVTKLCPLPLQ